MIGIIEYRMEIYIDQILFRIYYLKIMHPDFHSKSGCDIL